MLITKKNMEVFEAVSEVDGITVMTFKAEVDKKNPGDSSLDVKKETESLYHQYRDEASADREQFEDMIFAMLDDLENPHPVTEPETIDGEYVDAKDIVVPEDINHDFDEEVISNVED